MKVIIGAGKTAYEGWISTQENELDLLNRADFERMFAEVKPFAFLAEHVWEHMTFDDGCIAAQNCYDFLADGGYIRVAVPDANFRNEWYQGIVKVGGNGDPNHPAYTHKIVYDYKTLCAAFEKAGLLLICLNTAMKTEHSIINTGMNLMEKSDVHYVLTHEIKTANLAWCRLLLMPRSR